MLRGDAVVLRAVQREDLPRLYELLKTDLEVMTRVSDRPPRPVTLEEMIASYEGSSEGDDADAWFAIVVDDAVVGECGLHEVDHYQGTCHVGISLGRAYWSKGYGRDAVRTLVDYAFRHLRMRKVSLEVLADDERAVRAYTAAGFHEEGRLRDEAWFHGAEHDVLRMAVLRAEWVPPSTG
ncbi:MAG TPA: GNAT family protein [Actinomycetota bacterium]|nr:GNAT family protein [Actinomycetota bacterium]